MSWSIELKVGLNEVAAGPLLPAMGGLVSLPPNELDALVDMSYWAAPPGFSFNCLFK